MKKLGLLALVVCFMAASQIRAAQKKEPEKPLEIKTFEIVAVSTGPLLATEGKKTATYMFSQSDNSWRIDTSIEVPSGQGEKARLSSTRIIKDGFRYTFSLEDSNKQVLKCKELQSTESGIMGGVIGRPWFPAPAKDAPALSAGGTETIKMPNEKWMELDLSVYKLRNKNDNPFSYCLVYVDDRGVVKRELWYVPSKDGKSAVLDLEENVTKYETNKTAGKELFDPPAGYNIVYGGVCGN